MKLYYCTFPNQIVAQDTCTNLIESRLIACANILTPMNSIYLWKGHIEKAEEVPVLLKTSEEKSKVLLQEFKKLHPYETPCLIELKTGDALPDYIRWISESLQSP